MYIDHQLYPCISFIIVTCLIVAIVLLVGLVRLLLISTLGFRVRFELKMPNCLI